MSESPKTTQNRRKRLPDHFWLSNFGRMLCVMGMMTRTILLALAAAGFATGAGAQSTALPLTNMNFDLWCQEEQQLPADRCDKLHACAPVTGRSGVDGPYLYTNYPQELQ